MNLYTSDLHFGHTNAIGFDHRPFADRDEQVDMTTVDKVCSDSHSWSKEEEGYFLVKFFEIVMSRIDDRATQRILRDVDNTTLTKAMKGLDENTKRKYRDCSKADL